MIVKFHVMKFDSEIYSFFFIENKLLQRQKIMKKLQFKFSKVLYSLKFIVQNIVINIIISTKNIYLHIFRVQLKLVISWHLIRVILSS